MRDQSWNSHVSLFYSFKSDTLLVLAQLSSDANAAIRKRWDLEQFTSFL